MHQTFSLAVIPFHRAHVALTTVLHLTTDTPFSDTEPSSPSSEILLPIKDSQHAHPTVYRITKQEDFYQPSEFVKFLPGGGVWHKIVLFLQYWNTFLSLLGAIVGYPVTAYMDWREGNRKRKIKGS